MKGPFGWFRRTPKVEHSSPTAGMNGFGAPLKIVYTRAPQAMVDNGALYVYRTFLQPRWTPIGGGIPNKRDIGTAPPSWSKQGVQLAQLGAPGNIAGQFISTPLLNVNSQDQSEAILAVQPFGSFQLPVH